MKKIAATLICILFLFPTTAEGQNLFGFILKNHVVKSVKERQEIINKNVERNHKEHGEKTIEIFKEKYQNMNKEDFQKFDKLLEEFGQQREKIKNRKYKSNFEKWVALIEDSTIISWEHEKLQKFLNDPKNYKDEAIKNNKKWFGFWMKSEWREFIDSNKKLSPLEMQQRTTPLIPGNGAVGY